MYVEHTISYIDYCSCRGWGGGCMEGRFGGRRVVGGGEHLARIFWVRRKYSVKGVEIHCCPPPVSEPPS